MVMEAGKLNPENRYILSPQFIGRPLPGLKVLAGRGWRLNEPPLAAAGDDPQARMGAIHRPLAAFVEATVREGGRPVSISGDCCSAIAVLAGLQRAGVAPKLIWLDAHGDFNTPETSPGGFWGGMPLAILVGRGDQTMARSLALTPLAERDVILADARDLDPGEDTALAASGLTHVRTIRELLAMTLPDGPVWVHFDTDILDAAEAPAQNYPVAGGPTSADMAALFDRLAQSGRVVAVSLSSWNPRLDEGRRCERLFMGLLKRLVG